jgi:hypothetical protein
MTFLFWFYRRLSAFALQSHEVPAWASSGSRRKACFSKPRLPSAAKKAFDLIGLNCH